MANDSRHVVPKAPADPATPMTRAAKSIQKGLREAIAYAKSQRSGTAKKVSRPMSLRKSIREAHADVAAYLAGDPSRVEISTVTVARKAQSKRRKSRAGKN